MSSVCPSASTAVVGLVGMASFCLYQEEEDSYNFPADESMTSGMSFTSLSNVAPVALVFDRALVAAT